jgi:phenol 2-monooxygenase
MVIVRPDQYVSHVLPLHDHAALADFFSRILIDAG